MDVWAADTAWIADIVVEVALCTGILRIAVRCRGAVRVPFLLVCRGRHLNGTFRVRTDSVIGFDTETVNIVLIVAGSRQILEAIKVLMHVVVVPPAQTVINGWAFRHFFQQCLGVQKFSSSCKFCCEITFLFGCEFAVAFEVGKSVFIWQKLE